MATLQQTEFNLIEIAKRTVNGQVITISEVLSRVDEIIMDMAFVPCNQVSAFAHSERLSLPSGTWRILGTGAATEVSHVKQVVDNVGTIESWAEVDELTIKKAIGDRQALLNSEFKAFIEGLGQSISSGIVTSDTQANPERFDGLNIRLASLGTYIKGCGGTGSDLTSLYGIQWGPELVHGIYEPGIAMPDVNSPVGVDYKGLQTVEDGSSTTPTRRDVYQAKFQASLGLAVWDQRNLFRLANIEDDISGANILEPDLLVQCMRQGKKVAGAGFPQWILYAHEMVLTQLDILAMDKSNVLYAPGQIWGEPVTTFRMAPIRQLNAITITQSAVS